MDKKIVFITNEGALQRIDFKDRIIHGFLKQTVRF